MPRGTRPERYIRQPRISPFPTPTTKPGPSWNVHSWRATSAWPTVDESAASAPLAPRVLPQRHDVRTLRTPTAMKTDSITGR